MHCTCETANITVLDGDGQCCVLNMFAPYVQTCYESVQSRVIFVFQGGDGQVCDGHNSLNVQSDDYNR